jgi:hypothetical protein
MISDCNFIISKRIRLALGKTTRNNIRQTLATPIGTIKLRREKRETVEVDYGASKN